MDGSGNIDRQKAEMFLYSEARLADERKYDDWAALWTNDAIYWVPSNEDDYDPRRHLSIIYDNRNRIQDRIDRLKSGKAWAQEPLSKVCRLISNIETAFLNDQAVLEVRSNFVLGECRKGVQATYFARQIHHLRATSEGIRMSFKKVLLINNDEPIHNLSFLV
jgi:3-phenylpropionate/cinnamic acid dioxygenase small subunit